MQLVIDIGNSATKYAVFKGNILIENGQINCENEKSEITQLLNKYPELKKAIISNVRNNPLFINYVKNKLYTIELTHTTPLPIKKIYNSPETLGRDRMAGAVGAFELYGKPILSIDAGTCITFDFVNENGEYVGGAISPGIEMRLRAMHQFTGKLPLVNFNKNISTVQLIGKNTHECLLAGAINGAIFEIEKSIEHYQKQYPELKIVICGGDAAFLAKELKNSIFADPLLVLKGLNIILQFNVPDK